MATARHSLWYSQHTPIDCFRVRFPLSVWDGKKFLCTQGQVTVEWRRAFAFSSKYIHIIRETLWCVRPSCRPRTRIHRNQNQSRWIVIYIYRDIEIYRCTLCVYSVWRLLPWKAFVSTSWRFTLISASNAYIKMQYKCVWRTNICIWNTFQLPKKKP